MAYKFVEFPTVDAVKRAATTLASQKMTSNNTLVFTARNNQGTGYVEGSDSKATKTVSLSVNGATITASDGTNSISKSVKTTGVAKPSIVVVDDNDEGEFAIRASNLQTEGYVLEGTQVTTRYVTLTVDGNTAIMECDGKTVTREMTIPDGYIDVSDITKTGEDITVSANRVTTPAGYYPNGITKTVNSVQAATPSMKASIKEDHIKVTATNKQQSGYVFNSEMESELTIDGEVKTVSPNQPGSADLEITPSSGYYLSKVIVKPIPDKYVNTFGITKTSDDLTASGAKVTVPAGYYPNGAEKIVQTALRASTTVTASDPTSDGVVTITANNNQFTGYVIENEAMNSATLKAVLSINGKTAKMIIGSKMVTKDVQDGILPDPSVVINLVTGKVTASVKIEDENKGYISNGAFTSKDLDISKYVDPSIIKKGETLFGKTGTYEGAGGGASIETCTVNVTFTTNPVVSLISATTFADGKISAFYSHTTSGTVTIPNVVCGSVISINTSAMVSLYWSGSMQPQRSSQGGIITAPSTTGDYSVEVGILDD